MNLVSFPWVIYPVLMFKINCASPIICLLIYHPPKINPAFSTEIFRTSSSIVLDYDKFIIVDFNFHTDDTHNCKAFLNITESCNLVYHALDLEFTLGLNGNDLSIRGLWVSNHRCILFSTVIQTVETNYNKKVHLCVHPWHPFIVPWTIGTYYSDTNDLTNAFYKLCLSTLNKVPPLKTKIKLTVIATPWIKEDICRRAERTWKWSKLEVHYQSLKYLLCYSNNVKEAHGQYFSQLISANQHNLRTFNTTIQYHQ